MEQQRLSRRNFLKSAAITTAVGTLAACKSTPPATEDTTTGETVEQPPAKEGQLLRYWTGWGGEGYSSFWEQVQALDAFKEILGNNTFEVKVSVGEEAILTAVAGGDPPDTGANINYLGFMARDILYPMDDLVAAGKTKKEDFIDANWNLGFYKGKQYGFPSQECFLQFGLNYNSKLVEEAGLDPNAPPDTWDGLLDWHTKLTVKDNAGNVTRIGVNPYGAMAGGLWDTSGFFPAVSWGWNWFDDATRKFDFNNEKMVDAFKTFKKFVDVVGVDNMTALYSGEGMDDWGGAYNAGVECMIIEGYWHPGETMFSMPEVAKVNKASWSPVPMSRKGAKVQGAGGHLWTIFKDSKDPETMYKIGELLNEKEPCDILWNSQGWLPATKAYLDQVDASVYPGLDFYFMSYKEATDTYTPPRCEIYSFIYNEYVSIKDKVNRDEMTAEQAAEELQKRAEVEYKNQGFA
jgi:multiple sugar transport system substrate-binding protein